MLVAAVLIFGGCTTLFLLLATLALLEPDPAVPPHPVWGLTEPTSP